MNLNPSIWVPHLKFILQTVAITYPNRPNETSKKKYYDFIHNLPLFFPLNPIGKEFMKLLDDYPLSPYLSSRTSFMKWVHFIFNKINISINKPTTTFYESLEAYYDEYKPKELLKKETIRKRKRYFQIGLFITIVACIYYFNSN